jgi:hypothetical protein
MTKDIIHVTKKEAVILDTVSIFIKQNERITIRKIAESMQIDQRRVCTMLARKGGLYEKFPELRHLVGRGLNVEYDVSVIKEAAKHIDKTEVDK